MRCADPREESVIEDPKPYPFRLGTASFSVFWLDSVRSFANESGLSIQAAVVLLTVLSENLRCYVQPGGDSRRRSPHEPDGPLFPVTLGTLRERLPCLTEQVKTDLESLIEAGWVRRDTGGFVAAPGLDKSPLERFRAQNRYAMVRLLRLWNSAVGPLTPIGSAPSRLRPKRIDIAWTIFAVRGVSAFSLDLGGGLDPALTLLAAMKLQCGFGLEVRGYPNVYRMIWDGTATAPVTTSDLTGLFGPDTARLDAAIDRLRTADLLCGEPDGRLRVERETLSSARLAQAHQAIWRAGADLMSTASGFGLERFRTAEALQRHSDGPAAKDPVGGQRPTTTGGQS